MTCISLRVGGGSVTKSKFELLGQIVAMSQRGLMSAFEFALDSSGVTDFPSRGQETSFGGYEDYLSSIYELARSVLPVSGEVVIIAGTQTPPRSQQFSLPGATLVLHDLRERSLMDYAAGVAYGFFAMENVDFEATDHHLMVLEASIATHCGATYSRELSKARRTAIARLNGNFQACIAQWNLATLRERWPRNDHFGEDFPGSALRIANDTLIAFHEMAHLADVDDLSHDEIQQSRSFILALLDWIELPSSMQELPERIRRASFEGSNRKEAAIDALALGALERLFYATDPAWSEAAASVSAACCLGFSATLAQAIAATGGKLDQADILDISADSALRLGVGLSRIWSQSPLGDSEVPPLGPTLPGSLPFGDALRVWLSVVHQLTQIVVRAGEGVLFPAVPIPGSSLEPWWWDDEDRKYFFQEYSEENPEILEADADAILQRIWEANVDSRMGQNFTIREDQGKLLTMSLLPWPKED